MARQLDNNESPFQRAASEGLVGGNPIPNPIDKKKLGRRPESAEDWRPLFIGAIMQGMSVKNATQIAGVNYCTPYERREVDEEFRRAWNKAADIGTRLMEQEAQRRAFHGTLKPVFHKGVKCGHIREYSDTLMIFLLKARNPAKYRDGGDENSAGRGITINVNVVAVQEREQVQGEVVEHIPVEVVTVGHNNKQDDKGLREAEAVPGE